jgi:phosphoribosyl-ATP pyrophosphohydrolase
MSKKPTNPPPVAKNLLVKRVAKPKAKSKPQSVVVAAPASGGSAVLDRLFAVILERRNADPAVSHSARLLSRGVNKVAQKFGEEAVECLIEAVAGHADLVIPESADVLYHLLVLWVAAGVQPEEVWTELVRREGISGVAEKAARMTAHPLGLATRKIP